MFLLYQAIATDQPHLAHMSPRGNYLPKLLLWIIRRWTPGMASQKRPWRIGLHRFARIIGY
jgi:hypothetical protein